MDRTCFVVSPIGQEGSEVRKDADAFLNLLIEPALEKYMFKVTRADKIPHPTVITSDIIKHVQEADICIIDITNSNPNVFYECGRRHETGKPFVQMVKKGTTDKIPFDVAGIRTIEYDLSSAEDARRSVKVLQSFIDEYIVTGFGENTAGYSMSSIGACLDRIERKINILSSDKRSKSSEPSKLDIPTLLKHPVQAFMEYLQAGNISGAYSLLDRVKPVTTFDEYVSIIRILSEAGHEPAFRKLITIIDDEMHGQTIKFSILESITHGMKNFIVNTGNSAECVELEKVFSAIDGKLGTKEKASIANVVGMAFYGVNDHERELKWSELAVTLDPTVPSYRYNVCLTYKMLKMQEKMKESVKILSQMNDLDEAHVALVEELMN